MISVAPPRDRYQRLMVTSDRLNAREYRRGDIGVYPVYFVLTKSGPRQNLQLRALCLQHPGRVLAKVVLFDYLGEGGPVTDNALTRAIKEVLHARGNDARVRDSSSAAGTRFIAGFKDYKPGLVTPYDTLLKSSLVSHYGH